MLTGPAPLCYVGESLEFTLTAYDSYAQYTVSGIDGDDTLTISIDNSPLPHNTMIPYKIAYQVNKEINESVGSNMWKRIPLQDWT